jgi:hypothetical protein
MSGQPVRAEEHADYRFAFAGSWIAILTVDGISESAVVTSADIRVAAGP